MSLFIASIMFRQNKSTFLLALFLYAGSLFAQKTNSVSGKVIDALRSEALIGATIQIEGTSLGTATDANGLFNITGIVAEEVLIKVAFIGYEPYSLRHNFAKTPAPVFRIKLQPSTLSLAEVQIEGKAAGQIRAMIDQKKAENIKNIVSAEQIATFPDMNAAEVMQRIPGITLQRDQGEGRFVQLRGTPPELTNFNINGEQVPSPQGGVRYVGMDIIPADQIQFIEVSKVMTPDMDADGIGGSVNIKTKEAADDIPDVRFTLASGYNNLRQTPNYQFQFTYGQRFGKFGFRLFRRIDKL